MDKLIRTSKHFLFSEYFADGVRTTIGVLLPALILTQFGQLQTGFPISIGALCASLTDVPGPVKHKRNGVLLCVLIVFLVALVTGVARLHNFTMGLEILLFCFFFSMFTVYGNRAAVVGTAALLVMILVMGLHPENIWVFGGLLAAGGVWYLLLSMLFSHILPYRPAQHALGECIREVAKFLKLKAEFYSPITDLDEDYRKVVLQQIVVSEKQDAVRELLIKSRLMMKESTVQGRMLVLTFVDVVDLYEQIAAIQYDYAAMRESLGKTGVLEHVGRLIRLVADELNDIGWAIQSNTRFTPKLDLNKEIELLRIEFDKIQAGNLEVSSLVLKRILVNIRSMAQRLKAIQSYFDAKSRSVVASAGEELEYTRFVAFQDYDFKKFIDNLTPESGIFRHSLRVAFVCLLGFILTKSVALGHHSYWVLLTIIVILKPAFSLTKLRNYQRLVGTIIGGGIGVLMLAVIEDKVAQFMLLVIFMIGTFSFQRINYVISVIFMTPFILIIFGFLGGSNFTVAQERIVDTLIGCVIAFTASYLIFPNWESDKLNVFMQEMIRANINYLQKLAESFLGKRVGATEYKLARKDVYVSSANLSAAFQRMISEPKRKQRFGESIYNFLVLNHILSSNIASAASALLAKDAQIYPAEYAGQVRRSIAALQEGLKRLAVAAPQEPFQDVSFSEYEVPEKAALNEDDVLLKEQLTFMLKVSQDICKTTEAIAS
ncbi:FUSC family membrane protein [Pontibacter silvestris]|uniref:FUSC family membrane protein n=1 Tax=Pontibacter silvestris TaxID=2305183 RepID=A0ABW4X429_9BACT|nr:FUSC family membrane protein [Pontibacter silvestris]MCC9135054.1 FUSC family protein [Pontibacter silvestris]